MSEYFRKYIKKEHYGVHYQNVRFKTTFKNTILDSLKHRGWKECEDDNNWDIYWAEKEWIHQDMDQIHLAHHQKVNHFRNHFELTRKDLMIKNLKRYKKQLEKENRMDEASQLNYFPQTYNLPGDYSIFFEEFKRGQSNPNNNIWIMKPSQGKGIFIINKMQQISQWKSSAKYNENNPSTAEPYVVQRYICNPMLIGGKKFDMRIYCLVTGYQPLTCYLYRTGFARFTHHRYDGEDLSNHFVHLTNVAIQKTSDNYDERLGGKWEIQQLRHFLQQKYGPTLVNECFLGIQNIIIKTLLSVLINDKHCFELYGFDVLLDSNLKPWLLEINASPSMTGNTPHDIELKMNLLDDVFTILDLEKILVNTEETQFGGFDCIYKNGPIKFPSNATNFCLLGSQNNRNQQLKRFAKQTAIKLEKQSQELLTQQTKQQQNSKLKTKEKQPQLNKIEKKPTKKSTNNKIQNNISQAQTIAITQSVINNVTNLQQKNMKKSPMKKQYNQQEEE